MTRWFEIHDEILTTLEYGIEVGEFVTAIDAARFIEKPWHWDELHAALVEDRMNRAEDQYEKHCELRYEAL